MGAPFCPEPISGSFRKLAKCPVGVDSPGQGSPPKSSGFLLKSAEMGDLYTSDDTVHETAVS